jgi:DNA-binding NarL/FixJ family response regulator
MSKIRVLIADDHQVVREGLERVVAQEPDMRVTALAADGEAALLAAAGDPPHVAIIDMRMPNLGGIAAIKKLRARCPETKIVVLSMYEDERYTKAALDAGAHGYVSKRSGTARLLAAVRAAHAGTRVIDGDDAATTSDTPLLSVREREVMRLLMLGHTSRTIATELGITKSSVDTYRARIFQKLGVESRAELVARVAGAGGRLPGAE